MAKIASPVSDYAMNYDLLHYHYDCWLFMTITGAINSAKQAQCSPTTALEAKTFSHQYWTIQHRYLIDSSLASRRCSSRSLCSNGLSPFLRG